MAATLNRAVRRAADVTVRYGGEEFACVLPAIEHEEAMEIAQTISMRVSALGIPHDGSDTAPFVTVSLGVATAPCAPDLKPEAWMEAADRELYRAKAAGRNTVQGRIFTHDELAMAGGQVS